MKLYSPLLLAGMLTLAVPAQGQLPHETAQLRLGKLLPSDSVRVFIEYPEYEPLDAASVRRLKVAGFEASEHVQFDAVRSVMRGEHYMDVAFVPVVKKQGKWLRLTNYELRTEIVGPKLSPAARHIVAANQHLTAVQRYAAHSVLAQGKWVKIRVSKEGIYQLSDAQLSKMGFADPSKVKLYGYGGRPLPDVFTFEGDDALIDDLNEVPLYRRQGSVLFFAEGLTSWYGKGKFLHNTFANYSYYFLTEGEAPATFNTLELPAEAGKEVSQVTANALYDNDAFVWYGGGRDFYDSKDLQGGVNFKLDLPGHVGGECKVYYDVSAKNSSGMTYITITPPSGSDVKCSIGSYGEGESARGYRGSFNAELGNEARFMVNATGTGRLNYLYTQFQQQLSTAFTAAPFNGGSKGSVTLNVSGANANTRVWQLGNASNPVAELPGQLQGDVYRAQAADGNKRFVLVDVSRTYDSPEVVGNVVNQDLHADAAIDYIIIVPTSGKLTEQAERLAEAHRQRNGLRVKVVNAGQLYNEFSSGTPDAAAYRRYLKMLYDRAENYSDAPKYLMLFGDCAYDNRMITSEWKGTNPDDYLLAYERNDEENRQNAVYSIGTLRSYVTDDYYAYLDDAEGVNFTQEKIDLGVGRFVCHTSEDAKWLVDQTLRYMNNEQVGSWKNRMWAIGDTGDDNMHMHDALSVARQTEAAANENFRLHYIFPDIYTVTQSAKGPVYPEATQKIKQSMQQGALIFNYNGHGSPDRMSHKFFLEKPDMLANISESLPVWVFASCEITPYDQAMTDMGRNALFAPNGPAVAVVCAARSVFSNYNRAINRGFVKYAFAKDSDGKRYTMGDALRLTKCELIANTAGDKQAIGLDRTINKMKYVLLGDPALALSYPDSGIRIDSINGKPVTPDLFSHLPIGDVVSFSGYVNADVKAGMPDQNFNGTLTGTVFTPKQTLHCKGYGNNYEDPIIYSDYTQTLFEGSVPVTNGRFKLQFMVPRGIPFSTEKALLSLYAVNEDHSSELNGSYTGFCLNGTSSQAITDSIGPDVYLYLNTPDFVDGATVGTDAVFYASVSDSSAISMVSGNLGHDMELWFDNDPSTLITMNDHFNFDYSSYSKGLVEYPLNNLTPGRHTLSFRVWDVYDNSTTAKLAFRVNPNGTPDFDVQSTLDAPTESTRFITTFVAAAEAKTEITTEVFNVAGMRVWHQSQRVPAGNGTASLDWNLTDYAGNRLERGVYLYRSKVGKRETKTKKLIIR